MNGVEMLMGSPPPVLIIRRVLYREMQCYLNFAKRGRSNARLVRHPYITRAEIVGGSAGTGASKRTRTCHAWRHKGEIDAVSNGAVKMFDPMDMPYLDRQAGITDPCGNIWWISRRLVEASYDD